MRHSTLTASALLLAASAATAGSFTLSEDRAAFTAALVEPYVVETFGWGEGFPITPGVLNASTDLVTQFGWPIVPGRIRPGATYSTPVGESYFFNIDRGGGFSGAFLSGFYGGDPHRRLTITFDTPVSAFGFDTNTIAPNLEVLVRFDDGSSQGFATTVTGDAFFGFASEPGARIASAEIGGDGNTTFAFGLDNVTYTGVVPEPAAGALLAVGLLGIGCALRRRG